jgi:MGT family glycosyltransferase
MLEVLCNRQPLNVVYTSRQLQPRADLFDQSYQFVGPSIAPRPGEEEFLRKLDPGPVIYVSLGSVPSRALRFCRTTIGALGAMRQQVVVSLGDSVDIRQGGPVPDNFLLCSRVPQLAVLSRACLFLSRAGINSANEALYYDVPMILFPENSEQKLVARQVAHFGAGLILDERTLTVRELRTQVERVLETPSFEQTARRIGRALRAAGGYREAADLIIQYSHRFSGPRAGKPR